MFIYYKISLVNMKLASVRRKEYITMWRIVMFISGGNNGKYSWQGYCGPSAE